MYCLQRINNIILLYSLINVTNMTNIDFEQIKKLPPDQRVKVLQELQGQIEKLINDRKREIQQAQDLLARAKEELSILEHIETPKQKQVSVEELFETNSKEKRDEKKGGLEGIARKEIIPAPNVLREQFEQRPIADIYQRMNEITADIRNTGVVTQYQENWLRAAKYEVQYREQSIEKNQYHPNEKSQHLLSAAEKIIRQYLN